MPNKKYIKKENFMNPFEIKVSRKKTCLEKVTSNKKLKKQKKIAKIF